MSNKQHDHYVETLREANQECLELYLQAIERIVDKYWMEELNKQNDEWWTTIDQDEEWINENG